MPPPIDLSGVRSASAVSLTLAEALPAAEAQDGLEALNGMLGLWRLDGLMAYDIERVVFAITGGTQTLCGRPGRDVEYDAHVWGQYATPGAY